MFFFKFLSVLTLTVLLFHFSVGSNDAIAPDFPAQVLGTRDDDLADTVNIKHKEGIYSKRAVTKASLSMGKKPFQKDNAGDWSGFVYFVAFFFFFSVFILSGSIILSFFSTSLMRTFLLGVLLGMYKKENIKSF